jgi:hypothetical protein
MYTGLVHLHNFLRWVMLLLLIMAIIRHLKGMTGHKPFTAGDKKNGLFLMITAHIQLLLGLIQWFVGDVGYKQVKSVASFSEIMQSPVLRFWTVEHTTGMLIAIILITIGRGVSKKPLPDNIKHKRSFWLYLIALILIIASVPWPGRGEISRPLL